MNQKHNLVSLRRLSGPQQQQHLVTDLDGLFTEIEDGTVRNNTFTGCIALENRRLPPLDEDQSRQIKALLSCAAESADQSAKSRISILSSVLNLIRSLWGKHENNTGSAQDGAAPTSGLLDKYDRVKGRSTAPIGGDRKAQPEGAEIQETDVTQCLAAQGEDCTWVLPYAWDIANRLNDVKQSEAEGDLALFFERRRKLSVRRPKSTRFEQSAQRYAAMISELYCDEKGDIVDEKALEAFISELVAILLDKTKTYWPRSPLLAIFDGVVATVLRPMLHKHQTARFQSEMISDDGVIASANAKGQKVELVTAPKWNEASKEQVVRYVRTAFKGQLWSFFMDRYAPYNREYARSPHLDPATLADAGYLVRHFGNPLHLSQVMDLLQPTSQADELAHHVTEHFRSDAFIDH